jgi:aspartate/methionine/tyrosine aminotransferase
MQTGSLEHSQENAAAQAGATGQAPSLLPAMQAEYGAFKAQGLKLDMSRGKPCREQLDLSDGMYVDSLMLKAADGTDCRNYGNIDGIPEARALFASLFGIRTEEVIVGGNSSLNLMYDTMARAYLHGLAGCEKPWSQIGKVKFLCPTPGYDRHFSICELFGMEMIQVDMTLNGPDMDQVESLAASDPAIKGIWCVPLYSNPTGVSYSEETVRRLAAMKTAASDFLIFWDNAYAFHHLYETADSIPEMLSECRQAGNPDRVIMFSSTSKITWPGAGIAILAASVTQVARIRKLMGIQTIGPDKITQLMHVRHMKDKENVSALMKRHADIIRPKFDMVLDMLEEKLGGTGLASWNCPRGGYFISLDVMPGKAKRVVQLAKEAGVVLTPAGATWPYGKDPADRNIRIAPTFPPLEELRAAIRILCVCVQLAALENS